MPGAPQRAHAAWILLLAGTLAPLTAADQAPQDGSETQAQVAAQAGSTETAARLLRTMHRANRAQVQAALLARKKVGTESARRFAERLLRDHKQGDLQVLALADQMGVDLEQGMPGAEDGTVAAVVDQLKQAPSGTAFDGTYIAAMAKSHRRMLDQVQGSEPAHEGLHELTTTLAPIIEQHIALATLLQDERQDREETP